MAHQDKTRVIKFTAAGMKPDVRLKVLDQAEFHVHSTVLKLYSAFFRKFLDSPEKKKGPASREFQYEWVSQIDNDRTWHLISASSMQQKLDLSRLTSDPNLELEAFTKLMCAFYLEPYTICNWEELRRMTDMAEYYLALRILSRTLTESINASPRLLQNIHNNGHGLLPVAAKLRHAPLFRDCLIYLNNPFENPGIFAIDDSKLYRIATAFRNNVCSYITEVEKEIFDKATTFALNGKMEYPNLGVTIQQIAFQSRHSNSKAQFHFPQYFRNLFKAQIIDDSYNITILLSNNTEFRKDCVSGEGDWEGGFLCGYIPERDLPWDVNETDW